jgi:phosphatidylethanolamine-binding protein (PEBP) family uncharacterized protein
MAPTIFNYPILNRIYNFYQRECKRSPEYFLTNFSGPNYCGSKLLINYENMHYIRNGEFIPKAKARNSPYIKLTYVTKVEPFTLIMNDPDSAFPSGNTVHWVIVNITPISGKYIDNNLLPGITLGGSPLYGRIIPLLITQEEEVNNNFYIQSKYNINNINNTVGNYIVNYIGPAPPINTGLHKYVFTLYTQRGEITYNEPISIEESQQELFSQLNISQSDSISSLYFVSSYYPN